MCGVPNLVLYPPMCESCDHTTFLLPHAKTVFKACTHRRAWRVERERESGRAGCREREGERKERGREEGGRKEGSASRRGQRRTLPQSIPLHSLLHFSPLPQSGGGAESPLYDSIRCVCHCGVTSSQQSLVELQMTVKGAKLWYPHGYGSQPLYNFQVSFSPAGNDQPSSLTRRLGFRTIELVREPLPKAKDPSAESFFFRVNGIPVYAKGAWPTTMDGAKACKWQVFRGYIAGNLYTSNMIPVCDGMSQCV